MLEVFREILHGSILSLLLFSIIINDIFVFVKNSTTCNVAEDNRLYLCEKLLLQVKQSLIYEMKNLLKQFRINSLKSNPEKF